MAFLDFVTPGWRKIALILIPVVIGIGLFFSMALFKKAPRQKAMVTKSPVVRVMTITPVKLVPRAYGYGNAVPIRVWKAIAQVSGKIIYAHKDLQKGKRVKKGTILLRIDPSEFNITISQLKTKIESYRIQLKELEVQKKNNQELLKIQKQTLNIKQKDLDRQKKLFSQKMIAAKEYETQLQALITQQAQVQSIQNSLNLVPYQRGQLQAQVKQAQGDLSNARLQLSYTEVKAPFDIQIASVNNKSSEFVQKGQTIFIANDTSAVEIEAQFVPGSARPVFLSLKERLKDIDLNSQTISQDLGISAIVRIPGDTLERHSWPAELNRVSDAMDIETRTMGMIFIVKNDRALNPGNKQRPIFNGMYCEVELRGRTMEDALVIPRSAIHPGNIVYLMTSDKKLEKRTIQPGFSIENITVPREGLKAGETLILSDVIPAVSGMTVDPVEDKIAFETLKREAMGVRK